MSSTLHLNVDTSSGGVTRLAVHIGTYPKKDKRIGGEPRNLAHTKRLFSKLNYKAVSSVSIAPTMYK